MLSKLRSLLSKDLSIDLGTANTLVYARGKGIILNEPSVVAVRSNNRGQRSILAVGESAKIMLGRTPGSIEAIRPLKDGVIADFTVTEQMLQFFIRKTHEGQFFAPSPNVLICVPCGSTQVERRAIRESALGAGASKVFLIEEPLAAAIGAGLSVSEACGSMVVDIGGGTTEVATLSLNGSVYAESTKVGGNTIDECIIRYIRQQYGTLIGESTAEKIKINIGAALMEKGEEDLTMNVSGRNISEGIPRTIVLKRSEMVDLLADPVEQITSAIRTGLEKTPPELASDIAQNGIVLTGGGSLLHNLDKYITNRTHISTSIAENPLLCVAKGGGLALDLMDTHNAGEIFITE